ncbi:MAG: hypothetical protein Fur0012_08900 [Elusimicrobiota bacterium]
MSKKAIILYSGGKNSHLALLTAVKKGFEPVLWHIDAGPKKHIFFSNYADSELIKAQAGLAGFKVSLIKVKTLEPEKIFSKIIEESLKSMSHSDKLVYFSSNDYQEEKKDKRVNAQFRKICKKHGVQFISFQDIIGKDDSLTPIKMAVRKGIKSVVIGLERHIDKSWLLKPVDLSFAKMIDAEMKAGKPVDANSYQSLVLESPLFGNKKIKLIKTDYSCHPKDLRHFIMIRKYGISVK